MAFGCIYVPDFLAQAATREEAPAIPPIAILDGPDSMLRVCACNQAARSCGIEIGMTRLQAEVCAGVVLRKRELALEESAQNALLHCGYGFSPRLESTGPGIVMIDLAGTETLLGSLQAIGQELANRSRACGFDANVGIAGNLDAALCGARGFAGITVIAPGDEARTLAPLPVEVLQPGQEILQVLDGWGIRTFHVLALLPPIALTERLGQEGLRLQRLARGEAERVLVPVEPPSKFSESIELDEPVQLLEPLAFVLNPLLEQITSRLVAKSLGTDHIHVDLELEIHRDRQTEMDSFADPPESYHRSLKLPVPTQDFRFLLKLLQLDLAAHPPQGPVKKIMVTAEPSQIRSTQNGLFQALAPEPGKLEVALARLFAVVGERDESGRSRVGAPMVLDSHCPDNFAVVPFRSDVATDVSRDSSLPRLALRLFRPAVTAKVQLRGSAPTSVVFAGTKAEVMTCSGPWRSGGEWWEQNSEWQRDEWDAVLKMGDGFGLYRLVHDLRLSQWFVEGIYD